MMLSWSMSSSMIQLDSPVEEWRMSRRRVSKTENFECCVICKCIPQYAHILSSPILFCRVYRAPLICSCGFPMQIVTFAILHLGHRNVALGRETLSKFPHFADNLLVHAWPRDVPLSCLMKALSICLRFGGKKSALLFLRVWHWTWTRSQTSLSLHWQSNLPMKLQHRIQPDLCFVDCQTWLLPSRIGNPRSQSFHCIVRLLSVGHNFCQNTPLFMEMGNRPYVGYLLQGSDPDQAPPAAFSHGSAVRSQPFAVPPPPWIINHGRVCYRAPRALATHTPYHIWDDWDAWIGLGCYWG